MRRLDREFEELKMGNSVHAAFLSFWEDLLERTDEAGLEPLARLWVGLRLWARLDPRLVVLDPWRDPSTSGVGAWEARHFISHSHY